MIFDNEKQRQIILELLATCTVPGKAIDEIFEFKNQVIIAELSDEKTSGVK